ncbi:tail fiber assembly protein [Neisseriaceae bacterium JH1-16]|nr:tail fiber assembly protein [Neisseriaceae bacterium JH1-16]
MTPLQDAVTNGWADDDDKAELLRWQRYRYDLSKVAKQASYPLQINWPTAPAVTPT